MSYLTATNSGFSQAIISFWFKIPQASLDAAQAAYTGEDGKILDGIVPLVVMGKEGAGDEPTHTDITHDVLNYTAGDVTNCAGGLIDIQAECTSTYLGGLCCGTSLITAIFECNCVPIDLPAVHSGTTYKTSVTGPAPKTDPTFIGVDGRGTLYVNFESTIVPSVGPPDTEVSGITPGSQSSGGQIGECSGGTRSFGCDVLCCVCLIIECSNDIDNGDGEDNTVPSPPAHPPTSPATSPENQKTPIPGDWETSAIYSDQITVTADEWHHILVSVDLKPIKTHGGSWTGSIGDFVDSAAILYVALDDKNYTKWDLSSDWAEKGDNDVISDGGWDIAGSSSNSDGEFSTYSADSTVPGGDIGMPAPAHYVNNVYHCEMAEFQMWTGQTLNPKDESKRRLFLDYKKAADGTPIPDNDGKLRLKPVDPKLAEEALGKPNIVLHGSSKWKAGKNTGAGPQFAPTGEIKSYKPDPAVLPAP